MSDSLFDGKSFYGYPFWNTVNRMVVNTHFHSAYLTGLDNLPESGPFLLIANHSSRWDGPVVQYILNRRANYMVSPNEMKGIQKPAVLSVGALLIRPQNGENPAICCGVGPLALSQSKECAAGKPSW